jgi:ribosomal protein S1
MTDQPAPLPDSPDDQAQPHADRSRAWERLRPYIEIGQQFTGTVVWVLRPGATGIGVDLGLPVDGFVDVLLLPFDADRWPAEGTVTDFKIWWMDDRPQIRLVPVEPLYRREDFDTWILSQPGRERFRPSSE